MVTQIEKPEWKDFLMAIAIMIELGACLAVFGLCIWGLRMLNNFWPVH